MELTAGSRFDRDGRMKIENIMEALTKDALYTYEFDVTTGVVGQEIVGKDGFNYTEALGLNAPCSFDEMVKRSFGDTLKCRYTADSYIRELSCRSLLHAFVCGKRRLEANLYRADSDEYVRLLYFLAQDEESGHVKAYVICEDITDLEKGKSSSADLDNKNLKIERDTLTREKRDLTEERDTLTQEKKDLTEERDTLTQEKRDLTEERDGLTQEKRDLTEERDGLRQEKRDLTEERDGLREEKRSLTEERDTLTQEKHDLTEERDGLRQEKQDLTAAKNVLTEANIELTRAADAVHAMLKAGSYVCTYNLNGDQMTGIKYSEALRKLYGYQDEKDFPDAWESWIDCILPEDRAYVENSYLAAVKDHTGNTTYDVTYRCRRKDGAVRWQRAAGYVMRRADGSPITCYGLVMDVDVQKKAADKIEEALTQAQIANAAKTSFLARMSHDIRTPMNGILGLIEINEKHADELEFISGNRKKAKVAANYLLALINDVLQLSKLEDPDVTLSCEAFDAKQMAEDILTIIKMRATEYGITVEYEDCEQCFDYPYVWGSPLHVRQIFINVFGNSIKYNKKGGKISSKVRCRKTAEDQVVYRVQIDDTGIGMSEEFLAHLFEPFAREHTENSAYEGTGLGMAIVKQLIEKMGGTIEVRSKEGEGSHFVIELPFAIAQKEDIADQDSEEEQSDLTGVRVLLVEDNDLNIEIAETFLKDAGAEVTKAFNGQQAVYLFDKSEPNRFDVILMDVMMPVMNGYEATRNIRALNRPDAKTIPIIAMTANAFVEDIQESKDAGMNEHISKPLDIAKVIAMIGKYRKK